MLQRDSVTTLYLVQNGTGITVVKVSDCYDTRLSRYDRVKLKSWKVSFSRKFGFWPDLTRSNVDLGLKTTCAIARSPSRRMDRGSATPMKMGGGGDWDQAAANPGFSSEGNPYQKPKTQRIWPTILMKMGDYPPHSQKWGDASPRPPCGGAPAHGLFFFFARLYDNQGPIARGSHPLPPPLAKVAKYEKRARVKQGCGIDEFPGDSNSDPPESTPTPTPTPELIPALGIWVNPCRQGHFGHFPWHTWGGGWYNPRAISPLIELELRGKKERAARHETKRLVYTEYAAKVLGQPVTEQVKSKAQKCRKHVFGEYTFQDLLLLVTWDQDNFWQKIFYF